MGGKSGSYTSPPAIQSSSTTNNSMDMMMPMVEMMRSMMENSQAMMHSMAPMMQMPQMPVIPPMPQIIQPSIVSWEAELDNANTEAMNEQFQEEAIRRGRLDTVLTSPLLDDEDVRTTQSLLGGANVRP